MISAIIHGNEICGAFALDQLLASGFTVDRGRLILVFANAIAFLRFDPSRPYASRFVDEDMNRVWSVDLLEAPQQSVELARAREIRPFAESADYLLDLHSTSLPAPPMLLCGTHVKGLDFAQKMGYPSHIVADAGHAAGVRLRDFAAFGDATSAQIAMLVECGQHFDSNSPAVALNTIFAFLRAADMLDSVPKDVPDLPPPDTQCHIKVTDVVTTQSNRFAFTRNFQCFEKVAKGGTLIALDGTRKIVSPYDDCVLVMPTQQPVQGQTAVRLGRYVVK